MSSATNRSFVSGLLILGFFVAGSASLCTTGCYAQETVDLSKLLGGDESGDKIPDPKKLVKAKMFLSNDKLSTNDSTQVLMIVEIEKDWHINAHDADPSDKLKKEDLFEPVVTSIRLDSKENLKFSKVLYPKGEPLKFEGFKNPLYVYEGRVAFLGTVEVPDTMAGQTVPLNVSMTYQVCNDESCLQPTKLALGGKVKVAGPGDSVKSLNSKLFSKYAEELKETQKDE